LIHQNNSGEVVLDRVEWASGNFSAPFPALELHDYPRSTCEPVDVVIEAWVHEAESDAPEVQTAAAEPPPGRVAEAAQNLGQLARQVGALFRPKSSAAVVQPQDVDLTDLLSREFLIPVEGVDAEKLRDSFLASRGRHAKHLAIDIGAPRGTSVLATTDGEIVRIARERRGGKTIYQKDASGQYLLFYCHLSGYAENLVPGQKVKKGEVIGFVGSTGRVIGGPHLHFSITRLAQEGGNLKEGLAINPYLLFLSGVR
jgi:murein DD-endopeptidase MepM/ murein hydrolase activator NlpD